MSRRTIALLAAALAAALAGGCTTPRDQPDEPDAVSHVEIRDIPVEIWTGRDVVVVLDDSPAIAPYGDQVAALSARIVTDLADTTLGTAPEYQLGAVTTDLADGGRLHLGHSLGNTPRFGWVEDHDFLGSLGEAFAPLADVGTAGGAAHPLEALERALDPNVNPGLVRDDAYLSLIVVAAGDDPGTEMVDAVRSRLVAQKSDPTKVTLGVAVPCGAQTPRLDALLALFPNRASRVELCGDLAPLTATFHEYLIPIAGGACFPGALGACNVELRDDAGTDQAITFPPCAGDDATRCYRTLPAGAPGNDCFTASTEFDLRPGFTPFPARYHLECEVLSP